MKAVEKLIKAVVDAGLDMVLLSGTPMHKHSATKWWSRLDQVFLSDHSGDLLISCDTQPETRGINTDHLPILTELSMEVAEMELKSTYSFRDIDWEEFRKELKQQLAQADALETIQSQGQMDKSCAALMEVLQKVIYMQVPTVEITLKSKCWWTKELTQMQAHANKLGRASYKLRNILEHQVYKEHKEAKSRYQKALQSTKQQHWREWLKKAEDPDIWAANRITTASPSDRGRAKILKLKHKIGEEEMMASTNEEKSAALAKSFFPAKLQEGPQPSEKYPKAHKRVSKVTRQQI
jgi:hypothetical protein